MNTISAPLRVKPYPGTVKLYAEASEPFIYAVLAFRRLQNCVLGVHPSGDPTVEVGGC